MSASSSGSPDLALLFNQYIHYASNSFLSDGTCSSLARFYQKQYRGHSYASAALICAIFLQPAVISANSASPATATATTPAPASPTITTFCHSTAAFRSTTAATYPAVTYLALCNYSTASLCTSTCRSAIPNHPK